MTETAETAEAGVLHLERTFDAPAQAVFDAWTNPEVLRRWWGASPKAEATLAEVDLRVGGRYRLAMRVPEMDGNTFTVGGEFTEVRPPERLVYTWAWEDPNSAESLVTVDFREAGGRTTVHLQHSGFRGAEERDQHAHGWTGCLDNLASRVFGKQPAQR